MLRLRRLWKPFEVGCGVTNPAGTYVVFLAQPKMGVVMNLLGKTRYPDNQWTRDKTGALTAFDSATDTVCEYMNVAAIPAMCKFEGKLKLFAAEVTAKASRLSRAASMF